MGLTMQQISADFHHVFTGEGKFEKKLHLELDTNIEQHSPLGGFQWQ